MMNNIEKQFPILLCGPTASGKSNLALKLAKEFNGIIVNADALQIYDKWRVLTARPTKIDEYQIRHYLYGTVSIYDRYSVGNWLRDVNKILSKHKGTPIIIVGGTGLYFTSLINGLTDIPKINATIRQDINSWHLSDGIENLLKWLKTHDPETYMKIDKQNPVRVLRALEVLTQTGMGLSEWHKKNSKPLINFKPQNSFLMNIEINKLNKRISERFENMIENGALDEVKNNSANWSNTLPGFQPIGGKQLLDYINKKITLEEAKNNSIIRTRQYAKRQRTWFRSKMKNWTNLDA